MGQREIEQRLRDLTPLPAIGRARARTALVNALGAADVAPGALGYRLLVAGDGAPVADVQTSGDPWVDAVGNSILAWVSSPAGRNLIRWNSEYPRPNSGFERHTLDDIRAAASWAGDPGEVIEKIYERNRIGSQLRAMFYDDEAFVGWFGYYRSVEEPPFSERERRMLNGVAEQIHAVVSAIESGAADGMPSTADFVCRSDGKVLSASAEGRTLLERRGYADTLARVVRTVPPSSPCRRCPGDGPEILEVVPVDGESGLSYVVRFRRADRPRRSPWSSLTPRQLELARLAVEGLKRREIAKRLGLTENTVKTHLKDIYVRLGVSTRAELVRQWSRSEATPATRDL